jgi:hypothetical protein
MREHNATRDARCGRAARNVILTRGDERMVRAALFAVESNPRLCPGFGDRAFDGRWRLDKCFCQTTWAQEISDGGVSFDVESAASDE